MGLDELFFWANAVIDYVSAHTPTITEYELPVETLTEQL